MAFWDRVKSAVNSLLGRSPDVPPPPEIPTGDYIPTSDYIPPPAYEESAEDFGYEPSGQYEEEATEYHFIDDFGKDWGWHTQEEWYQDSLLSHDQIVAKYGEDHLNLDLLDWYQDQFGEWDDDQWKAWRDEYAARNG